MRQAFTWLVRTLRSAAFTLDSSRCLKRDSNFTATIAALQQMEWELKAAAVSAAALSAWEAIMGRQEFAAIENGCIGEAPEDMFFQLGMMYSTGVRLATDYVSTHKCFNLPRHELRHHRYELRRLAVPKAGHGSGSHKKGS